MRQQSGSIYATPEIEARIMDIYDQKLRSWPVAYESRFVQTKYGITHVIVSGPVDAPPVILLHAMGITAAMWQPNVRALSEHYRVYTIDTIGDIGKSRLNSGEQYPRCGTDYSEWLDDLFHTLEIGSQVNLIGASMGGWIAMNYASDFPEHVRRLVLLGPMGISPALLRVMRKLWTTLLFPTARNKEKIIRWAIGDNERTFQAFAEHMRTAVHCRGKMALPRRLTPEQFKRIKAPALLMLGGKDEPIGSPLLAKGIAERWMPQVTVQIVEHAGHVMSTDDPSLINSSILSFLQ